MNIIADTNLLVRAITEDHPEQSRLAQDELNRAETVALSPVALCELVWVLSRGYKIPAADIGSAIRRLVNAVNVKANRPAIEAGLAVLEQGGDFADGVIAHEGRWLGGESFVSFDSKAVRVLIGQGQPARMPA